MPAKPALISFSAGRLPLGADGKELPTRLKIAHWGSSPTQKGAVTCNATTAGVLMRNQAATKRERIALDFQHNTVEGSATYTGEPAKVAAYGNLEVLPGDGVYLSALDWTPEGKDFALGGHYPDVSPAVRLNAAGEVVWIHSAGLVRQGEIDGLTVFSAADDIGSLILNSVNQTPDMDIAATRTLLNLFLGMAGVTIPETATLEDMQSLAKTGAAKLQAALKTPEGKDAADAVTMCSAAEFKELKAEMAELKAARENERKQAILDRATAAGKVVPFSAADIKLFSADAFAAICDKLPAGAVPTEQRGDGKAPANVLTFSAADKEVMLQLGLTEEQWKKANAKA